MLKPFELSSFKLQTMILRIVHLFAAGQTNPEHLRQIYQAHLMLQLRVQEAGEYQQPEAIMTAARAVSPRDTISTAAKAQHLKSCAMHLATDLGQHYIWDVGGGALLCLCVTGLGV